MTKETKTTKAAKSIPLTEFPKLNPRKELLFNLIILVFCLLLALGALEIMLRIFKPMALDDYDYVSSGHYFTFSLRNQTLDAVDYHFPGVVFESFYNTKGFADANHVYDNPSNLTRVVEIGDSFTAGAGANESNRYLSLFGQQLNNSCPARFEFVNLGVGGTELDNYYYTYQSEGHPYHPKLVILNLFVGNDLVPSKSLRLVDIQNGTMAARDPPAAKSALLGIRRVLNHFELPAFVINTVRSTKEGASLLEPIGFTNFLKIDIFGRQSRSEFEDGLNSTLFLLNKTRAQVEADGAQFVVLIIPAREQVDDSMYLAYYQSRNLTPLNGQFEPQEKLRAFCQSEGMNCIDLLPDLRARNVNNSFYWTLDGHFNPVGHREVANLLYSKLNMGCDGTVPKQN